MNDSLTLAINDALLKWLPENLNPGGLRVNAVKTDSLQRLTKVSLNENYTYLPVTQELIASLQGEIKRNLPEPFDSYPVNVTVRNHPMAYYITKVDRLPERYRTNIPFVVAREPWVNPKKGTWKATSSAFGQAVDDTSKAAPGNGNARSFSRQWKTSSPWDISCPMPSQCLKTPEHTSYATQRTRHERQRSDCGQ